MNRKKNILSFGRGIGLAVVSSAALFLAACDSGNDTGTFGAPDRFAEDPAGDNENPPPAPGTVGGADPTENSPTSPDAQSTQPAPDAQSTQESDTTVQEVEVTTEPPATSQPQGEDQQ